MRNLVTIAALAAAALAAPLAQGAADPIGNRSGPDPMADPAGYEAAPQPDTAPDQSDADPALGNLMEKIEGAVTMPAGADAIAGYTRYYAWADIARTKITGVLFRGARAERKWIGFDDLPMLLDPGCAVVSLVFDAPTGTIDEVYCNGTG